MPTLPNLIYNISGNKIFFTSILTGGNIPPTNPLTGTAIPNTLSFNTQAAARDPLSSDQLVYYISSGTVSPDNQVHLGTWNPVTGAAADIGSISITGLNSSLRMAFRDDGQLYFMKGGALYTVSTGTGLGSGNFTAAGTTIPVATFSLLGTGGDIAFDPANPNNLYIVSGSNLYRVTFTGASPSAPVLVGSMSDGGTPFIPPGIAFGPDGNLYGGGDTRLKRISTVDAGVVDIAALPSVNDFATLPTFSPDADLSVTVTDSRVSVAQNGAITYTITVTNNSTIDLRGISISDNFTDPNLSGTPSWSAPAATGVTFPPGSQSGTGNMNLLVHLAAGATVTYTVTGLTATGAAGNTISNTATVKPPEGFTDKAANPGANSATDTTTISNSGVTLSPVTGLTTTELGGTATFTAVLKSAPTADVTLTFISSDTSEGTVISTLTFTPANWNTPQIVTITGVDDFLDDGDIPYTIATTTTSADPNYNNLVIPTVSVTNIDNETAGVSFTPISGNTTEAGGTATFTAVLNSQPTSNVTFTFTSSNTNEGTVTTTVTFTPANWNIPQTVTVTGVNDAIDDGNIPYTIATATSSTDPKYNNLVLPPVNVTNIDDDAAGVTLTPVSGLVTSETGSTATFTAVLNSQPTANVTFTFGSSDTSEGTVTSTITFTPANWNVPQTVTITGVDDFLDDGDIPYTITTTVTSTDPNYNNRTVPNVGVTNTDNETAGITFSPISGNTTEAGGTATFTAVLNSQPTSSVTFTFTSSDTSEGTVTTTITFTSANWNVPQTVTVTGVDDFLDDGDIPYTITTTTSSTDPKYNNLVVPPVNVTNTDNDTAGLTITPVSGLVTTEAGGTATFTAVLKSAPTANVTLTFTSSDTSEGTVISTLTFTSANWNTPQTVTITGVDDFLDDGDIPYTIATTTSSTDPNYNNIAVPSVSVTNTDNEIAGITFTSISGNTTEVGGTATFAAVLTSQPTSNVTLTFTSSDTTEGTVTTTITFTPTNWNTPQTVTVTGVNDAIDDGNIPYSIGTTVSSADPSYNNRVVPVVNLTNIDDDIAGVTLTPVSGLVTSETGTTATFTAVLNSEPTANVTLTFVSSDTTEGTVTATVTFTPTNWNTPQTVTITGVDDFLDDGDIPYTIATTTTSTDPNYNNIAVPTVSVTNTDNETAGVTFTSVSGNTTEAGGTSTFTAVLNSQPTSNVTFTFTSSDTTEGMVTTTITFTPTNWNVPQTVTITGVNDAIADGNIPYTITTTTSSTDPKYNNLVLPPVNVTNIDDDIAGVTLTPVSGLVTSETGTTATFTAVLKTQPTATVTFTFTSSDPTEGTVTSTIVFTPTNWNVPQTITVAGVDDAIDDGDIPYTITATATSTDPNYNNIAVPSVSVTNTDNETAGVIFTPTSGLFTTEAGGTASFTAVLSSQPTADVTFTFTSSDTTEGTVTTTITFTPTNWDTPQTVTVTGVDDPIADGNIPYTITATATSTDLNYNNLNVPPVNLTNNDNETPGITLTPTVGLVTTEAGDPTSFTAVLNTQPSSDVTLTFTSSDPSEGTVTTTLTFTSTNWNLPQTVTITGVDDTILDGDVPYTIATTVTSSDLNYNNLTVPTVNVTNLDDESPSITFTPTSGLTTTESGGTATFTAVLTGQPTADVTLTFTSSDLTEGTVTSTIVFTSTNWNIPQTVTITGVDDSAVDGNIPYTISTFTSSSDPRFSILETSPIDVINLDNETPGITFTPTNGLVTNEAGGTATFTAILTSQPTADVTLTFTSSDPTEGTVTNTLTFTAANWNLPQTVTITGVDDPSLDGDIPYTVSAIVTSSDSKYNNFSVPAINVTNLDNESPVVPTPVINSPPETQNVNILLEPGRPSNISSLMAIDPDGIASYTITTLPAPQEGLLYLGDPASGGTPIIAGQMISANQIKNLFFRATQGFSQASFTYTATDTKGLTDATPALVELASSNNCAGGITQDGTRRRNRLQGTPKGDRLNGRRGNDILHGWDCNDVVRGGNGRDRLFGDNGQDVVIGGRGRDLLKGGTGDDRLFGGRGKDRLKGGSGSDFLKGGQQRDRLSGGTGNDVLAGGRGHDLLRGDNGNDRLKGNRGMDRLRGAKGRDWLSGGLGGDRISGGKGKDRLFGGRGHDYLNGNEGDDVLKGGRGRDHLDGGAGNDIIKGGLRNDRLVGGTGDDVLVGGRRNDVLTGGAGRDRFVYRGVFEGHDRITDFGQGDVVDLSSLRLGQNALGKQVQLEQVGTSTVIRLDPLKTPNFSIVLENYDMNKLGQNSFIF
jgi:hypothetical protein